jgi:hypothetical protein
MVYFRKRLTPEILGEINDLIIKKAEVNDKNDDDENSGTLIVDATCAPVNIKYPTDTSLLKEAREISEEIIDYLHTPGEAKPRTYRLVAKKESSKFVRMRKPGRVKIRKHIRKQLGYVKRNLDNISKMLESGKQLSKRMATKFEVINKVYKQQKEMYDKKTHKVDNRIVSISQPHVRAIKRGKARAETEFGAKIDVSVVNGYTRLEKYSFDNYNESTQLITVIERHKDRTGSYPKRVLADKIYRNRENIAYCKERGIRLSGPALGRPKKEVKPDKVQEYKDICDRIEVERKFSLAKRKCGLGLLMTKLIETTACEIAMSIVVLNLRKIQCTIFEIVANFFFKLLQPRADQKIAVIQ